MATQTQAPRPEPTLVTDTCKHYWVLPASGDRMDGVCKYCGAERRFQSTAKSDDHVWEEERAADAAYWNTTDARALSDLRERAVA